MQEKYQGCSSEACTSLQGLVEADITASTPDKKIDMADHDVCTILDGESVAVLAGTVLPYERTLYRAFYLGFYSDNGPIVLIDVQILCVYKCKPVVSCVCPPSTAGVRMHCAGMLGAEKPYHHVPLLLRVTQ